MDKNLLIRFFEGQATTDEEMKVRKWMEASTENRRTYFKERKMYDMTLLLSKDTKKETVSQSSKKKFKFRKFIEIAAVAAITLVITLFYKNQERQEYWLTAQKISVPAGQRINLELSDGTKVWLNSRTEFACECFRYDDLLRWKSGRLFEEIQQGVYIDQFGLHDFTGDGIPDVGIFESEAANTIPESERNNYVFYYMKESSGAQTAICLSEKDHGYIMSSTEVNSNTRKFEEPKYYYFPIPKQQLILNENLSQTKFW